MSTKDKDKKREGQATLGGTPPVTETAPPPATTTTDLVPAVPAEVGLAGTLDELTPEEMDFIQENDGLADVGPDEHRLPLIVFNLDREVTDPDTGVKTRARKDQFVDLLTERVYDSLDAVFLNRHKTNAWQIWNQAEGRNIPFCRSRDRVTGRMMADHVGYKLKVGDERKCQDCPQKKWTDDVDPATGTKRRVLLCNTQHNVIFRDVKTGRPAMLRFQKTSEGAFKQMLQKFFLGQWKVKDARTGQQTWRNYPLYALVMRITLQMDTKNKATQFARPVFEKVRLASKAELLEYAQQSKYLTDLIEKSIEEADTQEVKANVADPADAADRGESDGTDFDPTKMGDGAPAGTVVEGEF